MRIDIGGGVRLFVDVDGSALVPDGATMTERPAVVLVHGGPGLDHSYLKSAEFPDLTDLAQIVYYDQLGHGRSDRGDPSMWTLDRWADDLVALCERLGIVRPIVVGESFGGFVAQRYLARYPEHPDRVALLCTASRMDVELVAATFGRLGGDEAADAARTFWTRGPEAIVDYLVHCMPLYSVEPSDDSVMERMVMNLEVMGHFQGGEQASMDLGPGLDVVTCPVLVAGGDLDPVCPIEMSEEIVASLSNADVTFERVVGASHSDVAARSEAALRQFIRDRGPISS